MATRLREERGTMERSLKLVGRRGRNGKGNFEREGDEPRERKRGGAEVEGHYWLVFKIFKFSLIPQIFLDFYFKPTSKS